MAKDVLEFGQDDSKNLMGGKAKVSSDNVEQKSEAFQNDEFYSSPSVEVQEKQSMEVQSTQSEKKDNAVRAPKASNSRSNAFIIKIVIALLILIIRLVMRG